MTTRRFGRYAAIGGVTMLSVIGLVALLAPWMAPQGPTLVHPSISFADASAAHWMGTDNLGRDLFSRLAYGARWTLGITFVATLLIMSVGVGVGIVSGYWGGLVDNALMRLVDVILSVPALLLGLAIVGTLGPGVTSLIFGLASVWWAGYARVVRGMVLSLRERGFVQSARALGASDTRIIMRHIAPTIIPALAVLASLEMGELVLAISGLSFLGLGAQPPAPEWGAMLNDARPFFFTAPRLALYPGLLIGTVVLAFNLMGDGLRDAVDPSLHDDIAFRRWRADSGGV
jgi:ABC-type dipeptide/oligopeptide/nickel transport system permease subunit